MNRLEEINKEVIEYLEKTYGAEAKFVVIARIAPHNMYCYSPMSEVEALRMIEGTAQQLRRP